MGWAKAANRDVINSGGKQDHSRETILNGRKAAGSETQSVGSAVYGRAPRHTCTGSQHGLSRGEIACNIAGVRDVLAYEKFAPVISDNN